MAQALEKIFLQKVAQMPQEEVELLPPAPKGKGRKPAAGAPSAGTGEAGGPGLSPRPEPRQQLPRPWRARQVPDSAARGMGAQEGAGADPVGRARVPGPKA